MGSLFQRLESLVCNEKSAEENILSEVLAYLLQKNRNIRRRFLNLIFHHHPQLTKHFMGTSIATRVPLNNGLIPDVVFSTTKGCLYVEIKIKSKEKDQSKAYLKAMDKSDRLAFLTPLSHRDIKEKAPRFVGHVRWEDLYKRLLRLLGGTQYGYQDTYFTGRRQKRCLFANFELRRVDQKARRSTP